MVNMRYSEVVMAIIIQHLVELSKELSAHPIHIDTPGVFTTCFTIQCVYSQLALSCTTASVS